MAEVTMSDAEFQSLLSWQTQCMELKLQLAEGDEDRKRLTRATEEVKTLKAQLAAKDGEAAKLAETHTAAINAVKAEMLKESTEAKARYNELKRKAKGIQQAGHKNADTLQNTIQTIQGEYKGKITVLTSERDDLAAKLQDMTEKKAAESEKVARTQGMLNSLAEEKLDFEKKFNVQSAEIEKYKTMEQEFAAVQKKLKETEEEVKTHTINGEKTQQSFESAQATVKQLREQLKAMKQLELDHEALKTNFSTLETNHQEANTKISELQESLTQTTTSKDDFESKFNSTTENLQQVTQQLEELTSQHKTQTEALEKANEELVGLRQTAIKAEQLQVSFDNISAELLTAKNKIKSLEQEVRDQEMQHKMAEKQNLQLIKTLKGQILSLENVNTASPRAASSKKLASRRNDYFDESSTDGGSCTTSPDSSPKLSRARRDHPPTPDNPLNLTKSRSQVARTSALRAEIPGSPTPVLKSDSLSAPPPSLHVLPAPTVIQPSVAPSSEPNGEGLVDSKQWETDISVMGMKLGKLQEDNFMLEDMVSKLKTEVRTLKKESNKKSRVILNQAKSLQISGRSTMEMDMAKMQRERNKQKTDASSIFGNLFGNDQQDQLEVQKEMNTKLNSVLEVTLMKNVSLQENLEQLGDEITRLLAQNKELNEKLKAGGVTEATPAKEAK